MRIKVRDEKIIGAIKRLEGIDIILKNEEDARQALHLILRRTETAKSKDYEGLKEIRVRQTVEHPTSAVEYQTFYEIEFIQADVKYLDMEIALIQELQAIFEKAG